MSRPDSTISSLMKEVARLRSVPTIASLSTKVDRLTAAVIMSATFSAGCLCAVIYLVAFRR